MTNSLIPILLAALWSLAEVPKFELHDTLKIGGTVFNKLHPTPCFTDWDSDGKKDILIGQFDGGKINLVLNGGTAQKPNFPNSSFLKANGSDISLSYG